ncbi:MAG TPA: hypothetical protein VJ875_23100 [Pyrinomonadaceae bacterium]|nr:hypothetical protein [Pyrinomonadaceae bacterium]
MNEYTLENSPETSVPPLSPQFDDERTILTARPVVPLEKINARVRHRRHWFLGGAFALAMLLGAGSALLAAYLRLRTASNLGTQIATPVVTTAPLPVDESVMSEVSAAENPADSSVTATDAPKKDPVVKRRAVVKRPSESIEPRDLPNVSEEDQLQQIRDAVLYDQWQERRARRVMRRERRNRADHHDERDLSNLDEIFEGRKKPY